MTLSPSRSSRNFLDSPNTRSPSPWVPRTTFIRTVFPFCFILLFAASIYFYTRITTQSFDYATTPSMDVSGVSAGYYSRQWLQAQVKMIANNDEKYHPGISHETLMQVDPFSRSSGINVWDYYPPQLSCPDVERVGKVGEGGKWVCGLTQLAAEENCIIYSFGISTDVSFEVELLLRTKCVIHAFDPTVGKLPYNKLRPDLLAAMTPERRARLHFHKTALGTRSASSEVHSYNEQLYDIMHRLGHSFINLLKVDIEGGEWSVFHSLFTEFPNRARGGEATEGMSLPVGQLVIELHYHTMQSIEHFFTGAEAFGLLPFSREINLQPCINGGQPVAAEYSFLHVGNYFAGANRVQRIPAPHTHSWHVPIKAVIYFLTQRGRVSRMAGALQMLYENFWQDYPHYPVVLFHDDLTAADERALQQAVPRMKLRFVAITLTLPDNLPTGLHIPERTVCSPGSSTLGYRHMCRFHATGVHKYLDELGYAHFDYIMRLDDDSLIKSPVGYDLFRYMRENNKLYAFPNLLADEPACVTDLWEKSEEFFNATVSNRSDDSLFYAWPKGVVFYNNFEISAVSLWHHPLWRAYMTYVDDTGGIYSLRWGDAPLHTIGVTMILDTAQVHAFTDIAYAHAPFVDQTPRGLPMPHMDPFVGPDVDCSYYDKWVCRSTLHTHAHNMTNGTLDSQGNLVFNHSYSLGFVPKDLRTRSIYYINATAQLIEYQNQAAYFAALEKLAQDSKEPPALIATPGKDAALFTFAHGGREKLLALTLQSFYEHYLVHHPAPVVLFYSDRGAFLKDILRTELRASGVLPLLVFRAVTLVDTTTAYSIEATCTSQNEEVRGGSVFLRYEAVRVLKSMGYSWMFRFGDDARLRKPTHYNIFEKMHNDGAVYGYKSAIDDRAECADAVWKLGESLCSEDGEHAGNATNQHGRRASGHKLIRTRHLAVGSASGARRGSVCGGMVADWTPHRVILTSFEISHVSVWDAPYCQRLFAAASHERAPKSLPLWGDSALHTICVVHTLRASQVSILHELDYMFNWGNSEWKDLESRDQTNLYQSAPLESLNRAFGAQRVGWLGGDIAASFPLPDPGDPAAASRTAIWLFGDSIIGVSTPERRIAEYHNMVSNTIGVVSISPDSSESSCVRDVSRVDYFWNTDAAGTPQPILTLPQHSSCQSGQQRLWPIAGVAVLPAEGGAAADAVTVKALLLVQVICVDSKLNAAGLQFRTYDTALVVVSNPLSSPQSWRYHAKVFPTFGAQKIHWMTLSDAKGGAFAHNGGNVYLLGAVVNSDGTGLADGYQVLGKAPAESLLSLDLSGIEVMAAVAALTAGGLSSWFHPYPTSGEQPRGASLVPHKLFRPLLTEASVHYDVRRQEWLVVSLLMVDERVQLCRTADIASPTAAVNCSFVATATPKAAGKPGNMLSYAAKAHHYLLNSESCTQSASSNEKNTPPLQLVVTYNTNALEADTLFAPQMLSAYTPKFLHIREDKNRH